MAAPSYGRQESSDYLILSLSLSLSLCVCVCVCVCVSVRLSNDKTKMADTKIAKLSTGIVHHDTLLTN